MKDKKQFLKEKTHHKYLDFLCKKYGLTYLELYQRKDLLSQGLKMELYYAIKQQKRL